MQRMTELAQIHASRGFFMRGEAAVWMRGSKDSLGAMLKRAVASGEIMRICRGLYGLDRRYLRESLHPYVLAQPMYGPSYISMESALSYHGWIPEAVHAVTSATVRRSATFNTPFGPFSFTRVVQRTFFAGVERVEVGPGAVFLLASPLKALADYVHVHALATESPPDLIASLRVDVHELAAQSPAAYAEVAAAGYGSAVRQFMSKLAQLQHP